MANEWSLKNSTGTTDMGLWGETIPALKGVRPNEKKYSGKPTGISEFLSLNKNFARPNLFEVMITNPKGALGENNAPLVKRLNINCHTAELPGQNLATTEKTNDRTLVFDKIYSDLTLGFYVNSDMKELKIFHDWQDQIFRPNYRVGYFDRYKADIDIKCLDRQQKGVMSVRLTDAYPKSISAIPLQYGSNDEIMNVSVVFVYRRHDYHWEDDAPQSQMQEPHIERLKEAEANKEDKIREGINKSKVFKSIDSIGNGSSGSFDFNNQ